ncbi:hypothetical protein HMPREF0658_0149, partial [Hoylesella marshii DSM 16973 = JCM 13450]
FLINKGLQGVPFVRFFVPVCKVRKGKNLSKMILTFHSSAAGRKRVDYILMSHFNKQIQ